MAVLNLYDGFRSTQWLFLIYMMDLGLRSDCPSVFECHFALFL